MHEKAQESRTSQENKITIIKGIQRAESFIKTIFRTKKAQESRTSQETL